jgi:hypothetical protein
VAGPAGESIGVLRGTTLGNSGSHQKGPVDFEDWIRAQLALSAPAYAAPVAAGRLRIRAPRASRGHILQAFAAGAAVTFFVLGVMAGAPMPAIQILPAQKSQSLPVTSLGLAPLPAAAAGVPTVEATTAATPRNAHHRIDRRLDAASRTSTRPDAATRWASSSTGQPRTGASASSAPNQRCPTR